MSVFKEPLKSNSHLTTNKVKKDDGASNMNGPKTQGHLARPKRIHEENEDDLLKFQEEFLQRLKGKASDDQPAAKVIRVTRENKDTESSAFMDQKTKNASVNLSLMLKATKSTVKTVWQLKMTK